MRTLRMCCLFSYLANFDEMCHTHSRQWKDRKCFQGLVSKSRSRSLRIHLLHLSSSSTLVSIRVCVRMCEHYIGGGIHSNGVASSLTCS